MDSASSTLGKLRDAWLIRQSGLLRTVHYRSQFYKEVKADRYLLRISPSLHYVFFGANENKNPNELFDTEYYKAHMPKSGRNPLAHFIVDGAKEHQNPGPFFDLSYYLSKCPEVTKAGLNPLLHYFQHGRSNGVLPHPRMERLACPTRPRPVAKEQGRQWLQAGLGTYFGKEAPFHDPPPNPNNRFIRFHWDRGGWNNIRMQAEVLVCLARRYGRALVLPPADRWYLTPGDKTHLFDFFDEAAFKANVLVLQSDPQATDIWEVPARLAVINTVRLRRSEFEAQQHRECWYFPKTTRMFGMTSSVLGSDHQDYKLVRNAFRVREELLDKTSELVEQYGLQPGDYLASHIRRGDFEQREMRDLSTSRIINALRQQGVDAVGKLLIVSDAWDEDLLSACQAEGWSTVCWANDIREDDKLAAVVDMLACCLAWRFVGTRLSTFSNGIMQWRGYLSLNAGEHIDALPRFTCDVDEVPWWGGVDTHAWLSL